MRMDFPPLAWHFRTSFWGRFKGLWAHAVQVAVTPTRIVEHLDVIEYIGTSQITSFVDPLFDTLFFELLKNDSATALSQQSPVRLMLRRHLFWIKSFRKDREQYWEPRSEWNKTPFGYPRLAKAARNASHTSFWSIRVLVCQPMTWRSNKSITTAKYSQPWTVFK